MIDIIHIAHIGYLHVIYSSGFKNFGKPISWVSQCKTDPGFVMYRIFTKFMNNIGKGPVARHGQYLPT